MSEDASISKLAPVKERLNSFERKHGCSLKAFEDRLASLPEDFERCDDFIEKQAEDPLPSWGGMNAVPTAIES